MVLSMNQKHVKTTMTFHLFNIKKRTDKDYKKLYENLKQSANKVWWTYDHCSGHDNLMSTQLGRDIEKLKKDLDN